MSPATVAWIARLHGWIGLWGAVLGLVFGVSGFVLNHRAVLKLDLMAYAPTHQRLAVPPEAAASPQALADWLPRALDLPRAKVRIPEEKRRPGAEPPPPTAEAARRWTVMLNTPQERINVVYWAGDPRAEVTRERANAFATLARLHTGAGLGAGWILFADTLAGAMVALTLSGVLLWTKLHPGRLLAVGLIGGTTVLGVVLVLWGVVMLVVIPQVLDEAALARARALLDAATFGDGRVTAGALAAAAKQNLQLPADTPATRALQAMIGAALEASVEFVGAALPRHIHPALINRYLPGMAFGAHVDNAIRFDGSALLRADLAATLFLNAPEDYDGGALAIDDSYGARLVKGQPGDLVVYPASSIHAVQPVTRGQRDVAILWIQSLVREAGQRRALYDLDRAIRSLRERAPESPEILALTGVYHNLLRAAAEL